MMKVWPTEGNYCFPEKCTWFQYILSINVAVVSALMFKENYISTTLIKYHKCAVLFFLYTTMRPTPIKN